MIEFRLYYDDSGKVVAYSCGNVEGYNYIVIDAITYAESNPNVRVVDGKIQRNSNVYVISKLIESDEGVGCEQSDICVLSNDIPNKKWKVEIYEHRSY